MNTQSNIIDALYFESVADSKGSSVKLSHEALVDLVTNPVIVDIDYKDFTAISTKAKLQYKDVGGYLFAQSTDGARTKASVEYRTAITIDIDDGDKVDTVALSKALKHRHYVHTTISSTKRKPRYRIIIPFSEAAEIQDFERLNDYFIQMLNGIGIAVDSCSTVVTQIMFKPSVCRDQVGSYYYHVGGDKYLRPDEVLDTRSSSTSESKIRAKISGQQNPLSKKGFVGAFCNKYGIAESIEQFLSSEYVEGSSSNSYTYIKGTSTDGVKIYENLFAYSFHDSDPCRHRLCHAFDLVRIHKFGSLDREAGVPYGAPNAPSLRMMVSFCRDVLDLKPIGSRDFGFLEDDEWTQYLHLDKKGTILSTAENIELIFDNDSNIAKAFGFNLFNSQTYLMRSVPWRNIPSPASIKDIDYAGLRQYLDVHYGISSGGKVEDGMHLSAWKNKFHPVKDFLDPLVWDGVPRVDTLLIDYMGAEDTPLNRTLLRKFLLGAVNRVYNPGCKFDYALILIGLLQGEGKSTLGSLLGGPWFSDSFLSFTGKESFEQLQGSWIIELGELAGMRKTEIESIKHFITKRVDKFRPAYGRVVEEYPRQCVFFGTTNELEFLKDPTGNRRFWPVKCEVKSAKHSIWEGSFVSSIPQVWAEVMTYFRQGETTELSSELFQEVNTIQKDHLDVDGRLGIVKEWLAKPITLEYLAAPPNTRIHMLNGPPLENGYARISVSAIEVWVECFGLEANALDNRKSREISGMLRMLGWVPNKVKYINKYYGSQRTFEIRE